MMTKGEFSAYVADHIKEYLPAEYGEAEITIRPMRKNNDVEMTDLLIKVPEKSVTPLIHLDELYGAYADGEIQMENVLEKIASLRQEKDSQEMEARVHGFEDYGNVKESLQIRICDPERNGGRLEDLVSTRQGDFAAVYHVNLGKNEKEIASVAVTKEMADMWGVTAEDLHRDALAADFMQRPVLNNLPDLISGLFQGEEPKNLLDVDGEKGKEFLESSELPVPMFCLTNEDRCFAASLILDGELMKSVGKVLGEDLYVLPSSIHEVLIVPVSAVDGYAGLQQIVTEINEEMVAEEEILSDKVQYYDREAAVLENAQAREERIEKEKASEQEKEPKSVLKLLAEKKEQCAKAAEKAAPVAPGRNLQPAL